MMRRMIERGETVRVTLTMNAQTLPDALSHNVMGELRGREKPEEIVVMGGHIDSWDVGQGAMDDAGGVVVAWEAHPPAQAARAHAAPHHARGGVDERGERWPRRRRVP